MSNHWSLERLGSVCTVISGQSPKAFYYNDRGIGLPFYQGKKNFTDRLLGRPSTWTTKVTKVAYGGDFLMSVRAPVGPVNQTTEKICIGRGLAAIRPSEVLNPDYLWYALLWLQRNIKGNVGAVFDSINKEAIESLEIPIFHLEEQHRIVTILDEAFEGLNQIKSSTESNIADLEEFRISFLRKVMSDWDTVELYKVATIVNGGTPNTKVVEYWGGKVQWLTPKDMGGMSRREIEQTSRTLTESGLKNSSARIVPLNSVILSTRAPIGHLAINLTPMAFNQGCRGLIPSKVLDHRFLYFVLYMNTTLLKELGTGTTFKELSATNLKLLPVQIPPITDQKRIVALLDKVFEGIEQARATYKKKLFDLNSLRLSLLQRAFSGKLT